MIILTTYKKKIVVAKCDVMFFFIEGNNTAGAAYSSTCYQGWQRRGRAVGRLWCCSFLRQYMSHITPAHFLIPAYWWNAPHLIVYKNRRWQLKGTDHVMTYSNRFPPRETQSNSLCLLHTKVLRLHSERVHPVCRVALITDALSLCLRRRVVDAFFQPALWALCSETTPPQAPQV